jgi:uncharacterized protein (TIGR03083 family)
MSETPAYAGLLSLIDERSAALCAAARAAPDLEVPVPGCPDWALGDLVAHLGGVQRFWAVTVRLADPSAPPTPEQRGDLDPHGDLVEWLAESTALLLAALRATDPETPAWAWWSSSGAPMTAGAIARHQVQEAAVHAFDAQEAIGRPEPLPDVVAFDGVAEFLQVGLASQGPWPHEPARLALTTGGLTWQVDLTASGARLVPPDGRRAAATVQAPASDLVLALYGRVSFDTFPVAGDRSLLTRLRAWSYTE